MTPKRKRVPGAQQYYVKQGPRDPERTVDHVLMDRDPEDGLSPRWLAAFTDLKLALHVCRLLNTHPLRRRPR